MVGKILTHQEAVSLLIVETEFACDAGCGKVGKGLCGVDDWFRLTIEEPNAFADPQARFHIWNLCSRECLKTKVTNF